MYEEYQGLPDDIRQTMEKFGTPDEINRRMEDFSCATDKLFAMSEELSKQHPNQWAALSGDELVIAESISALIRKCDEGGVERRGMARRFLSTEKRITVR